MEEAKHCAVIKYLLKKGMMATEIHTDMKNILGDPAPSYSVSKWTTEFKHTSESLEDDLCNG